MVRTEERQEKEGQINAEDRGKQKRKDKEMVRTEERQQKLRTKKS
jgi:hypothetical protein